MFLEKLQAPQTCVMPGFRLKSVTCTGINFHFVRDSLLLQQPLHPIGFLDRNGLVGLAMQDKHGAKAPHEEVHFFGHASEELDDSFHAMVDRRIGERKVGYERETQKSDSLAIDWRLRFHKTGCVPECFHPQRKITHDCLLDDWLVGGFDAGAVKIMKQVHRESLGGEHAGIALHAGYTASSTVERDDGRNRTASCFRQVSVETDGLSAAPENCRRLYDVYGRHLRSTFSAYSIFSYFSLASCSIESTDCFSASVFHAV